jgi:hypothetical protein
MTPIGNLLISLCVVLAENEEIRKACGNDALLEREMKDFAKKTREKKRLQANALYWLKLLELSEKKAEEARRSPPGPPRRKGLFEMMKARINAELAKSIIMAGCREEAESMGDVDNVGCGGGCFNLCASSSSGIFARIGAENDSGYSELMAKLAEKAGEARGNDSGCGELAAKLAEKAGEARGNGPGGASQGNPPRE